MREAGGRLEVLFTDLDGTLLDHHTYQPGPALAALRLLRAARVMVVPATAKTPAELGPLLAALELGHGWIAENGAAYGLGVGPAGVLGVSHGEVRRGLAAAATDAGAVVRGFADMSVDEVAAVTGLDAQGAARARDRRWSETFDVVRGDPTALGRQLRHRGLRMIRGSRFFTATGDHDKGVAVRLFLDELRAQGHRPRSWAVGDAANDAEMLAAVDHPMQVRGFDGAWAGMDVAGVVRCDGVGPAGWVDAAQLVLTAARP